MGLLPAVTSLVKRSHGHCSSFFCSPSTLIFLHPVLTALLNSVGFQNHCMSVRQAEGRPTAQESEEKGLERSCIWFWTQEMKAGAGMMYGVISVWSDGNGKA